MKNGGWFAPDVNDRRIVRVNNNTVCLCNGIRWQLTPRAAAVIAAPQPAFVSR
jgi:hypothetical protein